MKLRRLFRILGIALLIAAALPAYAQNLRVGLAVEPDSLDPQYHQFAPNSAFGFHLFDRLVHQDKDQRLVPGLAVAWRAVAPTLWEFDLRQGVRFHDGTPFEAADVAFSIDRARKVERSPSSFAPYLRSIVAVESVGASRVRITTREPNPTLPTDLSVIAILSAKIHAETKQEDFASGKLAVGGVIRWRSRGRAGPHQGERHAQGDGQQRSQLQGVADPVATAVGQPSGQRRQGQAQPEAVQQGQPEQAGTQRRERFGRRHGAGPPGASAGSVECEWAA